VRKLFKFYTISNTCDRSVAHNLFAIQDNPIEIAADCSL